VTIIYELTAGSSATCSPDLAFSFGVCAIVPARHKILGRRSILDKLIVYYITIAIRHRQRSLDRMIGVIIHS